MTALRATLGALLLMSGPVLAQDQLARFTVKVSVEGFKNWKDGQDYSNSKISERYYLMTHVQTSGEPSNVNVKDPQFAQQQMAEAAQVQQKLREVQARSGKPVPKAATTQEEYVAQQKKLAEDMQKGQAECKGDMSCLMKLSQEYAMQSAMISQPLPEGAAPVANIDDEDGPEDYRYLDYFGYEGCPGEVQIQIKNTSEGATADVSGMIPFKQADTAEYIGNDLDLKMLCLSSTLVYDLTENKIYSDGIGHPAPQGSYYYWDSLHGETLNSEATVPTTSVVWEWVVKNLRIADASGSASTKLPIGGNDEGGGGSQVSGEVKVDMSWTFERL